MALGKKSMRKKHATKKAAAKKEEPVAQAPAAVVPAAAPFQAPVGTYQAGGVAPPNYARDPYQEYTGGGSEEAFRGGGTGPSRPDFGGTGGGGAPFGGNRGGGFGGGQRGGGGFNRGGQGGGGKDNFIYLGSLKLGRNGKSFMTMVRDDTLVALSKIRIGDVFGVSENKNGGLNFWIIPKGGPR